MHIYFLLKAGFSGGAEGGVIMVTFPSIAELAEFILLIVVSLWTFFFRQYKTPTTRSIATTATTMPTIIPTLLEPLEPSAPVGFALIAVAHESDATKLPGSQQARAVISFPSTLKFTRVPHDNRGTFIIRPCLS